MKGSRESHIEPGSDDYERVYVKRLAALCLYQGETTQL